MGGGKARAYASLLPSAMCSGYLNLVDAGRLSSFARLQRLMQADLDVGRARAHSCCWCLIACVDAGLSGT